MTQWPEHPPREGIHLWICKDLHSSRLDGVLELLEPDEQKRARAYRFDNDRRRYLGSALLQRSVLAHYLSCSLRDLSFSRNEWGKPSLEGNDHGIEFNISRSHEVALLAVSGGSTVGVDVEYAAGCHPGAMAVATQFSGPERRYIETASNPPQALFEIWARKEAYIKGIGRGLSHPLHEFDVTPNSNAIISDWSEHPPAEPWRVQSLNLPVNGYAAALATRLPASSIEIVEVAAGEL